MVIIIKTSSISSHFINFTILPDCEAGKMWRTGEPGILEETGKISELGEINEMMNWKKVAEYSETGELDKIGKTRET
ncbi:hypothetical protein F8M41_000072 [Gigaspora margarita]|uniref:Uncharacterized protein n=1 Tax=Gigaspora margarita TaxID=4874 RepID=A0A8H4B5K0_GIGMA|nr:hypothetical protein F8M41_000072 [Gigaspora margarita]